MTEHSSTAREGGGGGGAVFYFKLMNKTSWQKKLANIWCSGRCIIPESGTETGSGSR